MYGFLFAQLETHKEHLLVCICNAPTENPHKENALVCICKASIKSPHKEHVLVCTRRDAIKNLQRTCICLCVCSQLRSLREFVSSIFPSQLFFPSESLFTASLRSLREFVCLFLKPRGITQLFTFYFQLKRKFFKCNHTAQA